IAFCLMERLLKPLLPGESYEAIQPYLRAARQQCEILPRWSPSKAWEAKVRVAPPAQPLLPPEPPIHLASETEREAWRRDQQRVRETLLEALLDDRQCRIEYRQIWRDEPAVWTVHPLVYLQRGPAFYLLCTIEAFADVRQLAVHRMLSATALDQKARKPAGFDPDREVRRAQGMGGDGQPVRLVARFWKYAGSHLLETPLSADQLVGDEDGDHFRLAATVDDTAQLRWWLLSFGSKVEVLEPEWLREEMANQAYWMNRLYRNPTSSPDGATDSGLL
ncbi:MAG TPA: WYL domain-containing protein, partial [Candidatus Competibacter sp.]|nr:WYL domain-containing protein [Candidatus Competibacter sp.]